MDIEIIEPIGPCNGVLHAIDLAIKTKKEHQDKDVFMLGQIVHNDKIINDLKTEGIIIIDEPVESYKEIMNNIKEGSVVIYPAHGHDESLDEIAVKRNLITIDAICPNVKKVRDEIKEHLKQGYKILYIGNEKHAETKAVLSIDKDNIKLFKNLLDLYQFNTNENIFVCLQTTLNYNDVITTIDKIKEINNNVICQKEICPVARIRQENVKNISPDADLILVIGQKTSSNTTKLFEIAKTLYPSVDCLFIEDDKDLDTTILCNKKHVALLSGTSAPMSLIQRVIHKLDNFR